MIIYLHGFNSSPTSHKAQALQRYLRSLGLAGSYHCPALPPEGRGAIKLVEALLAAAGEPVCLVGSSLGGFYATYLAERHGVRAVLLNPAIEPHVGLRAYLGAQQNLYTGERYDLTEPHLEEWRALYCASITPERYFLVVETGDEVLDYRHALERYAGAEQLVVPGGDHSLRSFGEHLPRIVAFARRGR
jgi:predicted esterase YcpF (UPF0227 family)